MTQYKVELLQKLHFGNYRTQSLIIKDIASSIQYANKTDLQELLAFLNRTQNLEIQTKMLSILSAYIISNDSHTDIIVKWNPVYDKIQNILCKGLPLKTMIALNFISALLYIDEENCLTRKKSLIMYARNMIRVSGCLSTMSNLFNNCMMYRDTWRALCRCLAECCRGSDINQTHCSHLIPVCVERCRRGNIEIFVVLQGLLQHNERNILLFLQCNGADVFTREFLLYDACIQLLNTLVQNAKAADTIVRQSDVVRHLQETLNSCGPYSQMGQWAAIVLYHINSGPKSLRTDTQLQNEDNRTQNLKNEDNRTQNLKNSNDISIKHDTQNLFQNIVKEIVQWQSKSEIPRTFIGKNVRENLIFADKLNRTWVQEKINELISNDHENLPNLTLQPNLSYSFLMDTKKLNLNNNRDNEQSTRNVNIKKTNVNTQTSATMTAMKNQLNKNINDNSTMLYRINEKYNSSAIELKDFKPIFISTPKKYRKQINKDPKTCRCNASRVSRLDNTRVRGVLKPPRPPVKQPERRSISTRFFSAINDSCTTLVKTVKYIFKTKENADILQKDATNKHSTCNTENERTCSYSFTNYMRKRDAVLKEKSAYSTNQCSWSTETSVNNIQPCETCNDTIVLRRKMADDEHLKKTIKKLKLGINLYGCDFKKISKTMWPRDTYMTPKVIYNLYRKLIVK